MNDWPAVEAVNVIGTRNVVEACLKCGVRRLVHFSSIHALVQEPMNTPVDELPPFSGFSRIVRPMTAPKLPVKEKYGRVSSRDWMPLF